MTRKVFIIGQPHISCTEIVNQLAESNDKGITIIGGKGELPEGTDISALFPNDVKPFVLEQLPRLTNMFFPKAKHLPKGHERGYKYHK